MNPRMTQNQAQPYTPVTGLYTSTYINVVKGKNIIPRIGKRKVLWKAIVTLLVNNQRKSTARRGKAAAHNAKTHPKHIIDTFQNSSGGQAENFTAFLCIVKPFIHFFALSVSPQFLYG
jgi:hypothetical protein